MNNSSLYNSPKQMEILHYLFRVRGANIKQIVRGIDKIYPKHTDFRNRQYSRYDSLRKLVQSGYVTTIPVRKREFGIYCLTKKGVDFMQLEYDIGEGDTGTGFGNDFGFFPYDYTKPPELRTEHFSLQTDIQNEALILQERHNGKFAYRDNLHSAVSYQTKQNIPSVKFRPDGELIVGDNSFLIEADMSTERGLQLKDKFVGYKKYLDYLTSQKKSLPKGVIFVFTNRNERYNNRLIYLQGQQRFNSLFTLFREHLKDYEHTFRLICVELKDFQQRMELLLPGNKKVLYDRVTAHLKLDAPKQADISTTLDEGYPVALIKQNNEHTFYMLQEIEGYTNVPWINGFRIYKELLRKYPKLKVISYYSQNHSIPPISQGHINNIDNPELKNYYKAMNFLNAGGMDSVWFDYQHKVLDAAPF